MPQRTALVSATQSLHAPAMRLALFFALAACGDDATGSDGGAGTDAARADAARPDSGSQDSAVPIADSGSDGGEVDTWSNFAADWFMTYCNECHNIGGDTMRDYRMFDDVMNDAAEIRCGVNPTALPGCPAFPPPARFPIGSGPHPDEASRLRLVRWIDDGLRM
jgi:hypothetical protein